MPHDLGFAGPRDKRAGDFIGKRSLFAEVASAPDRRQWVGFEPIQGMEPLPCGAHVVDLAGRAHARPGSSPRATPARLFGGRSRSAWSNAAQRGSAKPSRCSTSDGAWRRASRRPAPSIPRGSGSMLDRGRFWTPAPALGQAQFAARDVAVKVVAGLSQALLSGPQRFGAGRLAGIAAPVGYSGVAAGPRYAVAIARDRTLIVSEGAIAWPRAGTPTARRRSRAWTTRSSCSISRGRAGRSVVEGDHARFRRRLAVGGFDIRRSAVSRLPLRAPRRSAPARRAAAGLRARRMDAARLVAKLRRLVPCHAGGDKRLERLPSTREPRPTSARGDRSAGGGNAAKTDLEGTPARRRGRIAVHLPSAPTSSRTFAAFELDAPAEVERAACRRVTGAARTDMVCGYGS